MALVISSARNVLADAQLTSWQTNYSGQYARAYTNTSFRTSGTSVTTWANQSMPAYADIAFIGNSANWVYVRAADLPSYVVGPWLNPQGVMGQFSPTNQHLINRFPRTPSVPSGNKTISGTGYSGLYVNGVAIFNFTDGKAWDGTNVVSGPHNQATYFWHRNAPSGEGYNFDYPLGHQNPSGVYHTHQQPIALRYQLGDHVDYNTSTKNYSEDTNAVTKHSPIMGWAYDGYPIYGPYGYSVSNNASSSVRRMVSGYVQRDGKNGTDNLTNNLSVIPAWYARFRQAHFGGTYSTTATTSRAGISGTNTLGTFAEDYSYYGDLTNSATSQLYVPGTNTFDLDVYNGRFCVTPEFPSGTYAYFLTIDSSGTSAYPYAIAYEYYGSATGGSLSSISETVTTNFYGGGDSSLTVNTAALTNTTITLVWSSVEGGTYQVESSTNQTTWTTQKSGVAAQGVSTTTNYTTSVTNGTAYIRLTRTALATYDSAGGASGVVGQTNVQTLTVANASPVVANPISNQTATYGSSFSFTFATNVFTDADAGQTLTYTAGGSTLTNTGISFNSATRTFSATSVDSLSGGTIVGSYTISVIATDNGSPAKSATNSFTLTINTAAASVTPNSATRGYGAANPTLTGTLSNFVAADSITANYSAAAVTNSGGISIWPVLVTLNDLGTRLGNYVVTTNSASLTITQAVVTVTASALSRSYGATNPTFTVTYAGFTNNQTLATSGTSGSPALTTTATTNSAVGSYAISNALGTLQADNYTFKLVNSTLTVMQALLSVTASNASRSYGATNPVFSGSLTGTVSGDNLTASFSSIATTNSSAGNYAITPTLADPGNRLGNYIVTTNNGTLTVTQAVLTVFADFQSRTYGAINPTMTASYTNFVNGQTLATSGVTGSPALTCSATTNSSFGAYAITAAIGTLASANYSFQFSSGLLTVNQAAATVTADNLSRAKGKTNPVFTVTYSGLMNNETFATSGAVGSPSLTCAATTNSAAGSYIITNSLGTLFAPNYSFTAVNGILTVTNAAALNLTATVSATNSIVSLATNGTQNFTFTDPASGENVVIALSMSPYSASNASPVFSPLDFYGSGGSAVHLSVNSGFNNGDGNFVESYEGALFSASLVSATDNVATNTVKFGIAGIGFRFSPHIAWNSSAGSSVVTAGTESLFILDTNLASLSGSAYSATIRSTNNSTAYQFSDTVDHAGAGLVLTASFYEGTVTTTPELSIARYANGQFQFTVSGTTGSSYIVQASTNMVSTNWFSLATNTAPFIFTDTNTSGNSQKFYRVRAN